ncbi:cysteine--tRNA ligase [Endomicrobium proavitum]|uniref:Cysteine--tRNA ligase n=1 Tax=Endomicrobium proavitum TaxID=1408281 RepID=A0A0G3WL63_9BACT|nr:cysteine--tRNA ligase [Endomicrobium proavitum]AKL98602.1 Cysteine--tRNA ligase [Endomicrobium proavitum]
MIKISNTLTGKKEEFKPQKANQVSMYVCGVTPYDSVHLGHARAYVVFDIIKRHLLKRGFEVKHVQNFTDVDDKIIKKSIEKNTTPSDIANTYIEDYFTQTDKLNIKKAAIYPRVTEMIAQIISFVKTLIDKGFAYEKDGDVYFSVKKFAGYGKLSKRNLEDMRSGARVGVNEEKANAFDFALWKKSKEGEPAEVSWESPWGKGRPGWHIECSVMSSQLLGDTIDIHGGGQDLIFPHHENEIAQSEAATGKPFVNYWVHNGFVTINKEKMSKSLNNFFTLKEIFEKYDPRVVRYYLLTQHYKSPLDFSDDGLNAAKKTLQGLDDAYLRLSSLAKASASDITEADLMAIKEKFLEVLDDDFNSEKALSYLHEVKNLILNELFKADPLRLAQLKKLFEEMSEESLGITLAENKISDKNLEEFLKQRNAARSAKNWAEADRLRKLIDEKGYKIVDNPDGTSVLTKKI